MKPLKKHSLKKYLKKKYLLPAGVCAGILAVLITVLLLFSCGANDAEGAALAGRAEQLYSAVETAEFHGESAFRDKRPSGYPTEVGDVLAMMMSLHEKEESYLYHVAFRDGEAGEASTRDSVAKRLADAGALYAEEWVEISDYDPRAQGWLYFLFTAEEIRTLAGAGIECRFIGSGGNLPDDGDTFDLNQALEATCQIAGDSFRAKTK